MGNSNGYESIQIKPFEDLDIGNRPFDCVLVFDLGDNDIDWKSPKDASILQYEYLKLLDQKDIEERKNKFPLNAADFYKSERPKQSDFYNNERKLVIKALIKQEIKVKKIDEMGKEFEKKHNKIFYYIGISETIARRFASRISYELELEPESAISYLVLQNESLAKATRSQEDEAKDIEESIWNYVYVPYFSSISPEIYKKYDIVDEDDLSVGYEDSLFRIRDRLTLINEIICQDTEIGGAGIYVPMLKLKDHCIIDFFPLHEPKQLDVMMEKFFSIKYLSSSTLNLPLEEIRTYYGEYIALYFAYLDYFTKFLLPATIVGLFFGTYQYVEDTMLVDGIAYFALGIIIWALFWPIWWKNLEFRYALQWGTLRFDFHERPRPEFQGLYRRSDINGEMFEYFPPRLRTQRRLLTLSIVITLLIALFGAVIAVVLLRIYVSETDLDFGSYYVSVANALVIMFFNNIYGIFAEKLNSWENYQTETEYENNLIIKVFIFRFINSYATLYYIAFFRAFESESSDLYCTPEKCMQVLRSQLAVIFLTQLFVSNSIELGELLMTRVAQGGIPSFNTPDVQQRIWNEYSSAVYLRTFDDYCELIITFGYCSLFAIGFPYAPAAGFISGIVEARIDGYKLLRMTRRPFPRQADDIGSWQFAMQFMTWAILGTNLALIAYVTNTFNFTFLNIDNSWFEETITVLIILTILIILNAAMQIFIANKPIYIESHIQRQDHLEEQLTRINERIEKYLDSLTEKALDSWEKWNVLEVCHYLRAVLYMNADEYKNLEIVFKQSNIDGSKFSKINENGLLKIGFNTYQSHFILHTKKILIQQIKKAHKQSQLIVDIDRHVVELQNEPSKNITQTQTNVIGQSDIYHEFTIDNILNMAEFFEEDLTGQSKRKLWQKVDKDESSIVEKNEMNSFLYFSIVVYIRSKFPDANLPRQDDRNFNRDIIEPLKQWLLHYKISKKGLSFEEFDRYFSSWLREYYRERKANEQGGNKFIFHVDEHDEKNVEKHDEKNIRKQYDEKHIEPSIVSNIESKSSSNSKLTELSPNELKTDDNEEDEEIQVAQQNQVFALVDKNLWTNQSLEWEKKLEDIALCIDRTDHNTRTRLWNKFDPKSVGKIDTERTLMKLLYSLIVLFVRTRDRNSHAPSFRDLQPLLVDMCFDIKGLLPAANNSFITKHDFVTHIHSYLKKISTKHRGSAADSLSKSFSLADFSTKTAKTVSKKF